MRKAALALLLLGGCDRPAPAGDAADADNPLEIAARERGVVQLGASAPTGVFERRHDLGRDAMCVVPDGEGRWRFAMTAAFGTELFCTTRGTMTREADGWRLRFSGRPGCEPVVREDEDGVRLPGLMPASCANLCPSRASLAGLSLPRVSWAEEDAKRLQMRDEKGIMARPCSG